MRPLFTSEKQCVSNLFESKWKGDVAPAPAVLSESIAEPAGQAERPWFNCDFILHFVDWGTVKSKRSAAVCSVLPNTIGAELFLIVEKATLSPTALELNGGSAFSIRYYGSYIDVAEAALRAAVERRGCRETALLRNELTGSIPIRMAAFARILVVGNDVTFLYFPSETRPVMRGKRVSLVRRDACEIDFYADGDEIVCFDGWVRVDVSATERVLVALAESEK
jgi:hypothetical protein